MLRASESGRLTAEWRSSRRILVMEASALGMIAVIRSLGRAGYRVHAGSSNPDAMGLRSRYAAQSVVHPEYNDPQFLGWLETYVAEHGISAIVPSESFLHAIRPLFAKYATLMPVNPQEDIVYRALSKCDVHAAFLAAPAEAKLLDHLPQSILIEDRDPQPEFEALQRLPLPIFIKTDAGKGRAAQESQIVRAVTHDDALAAIARLRLSHSSILVQGFVPGSRVVADFCIWNDEIISRSMMTARHENPHYGGISTLRSVWWDQAIWDDAAGRLRQLGWNGCAMMEYRRDPATGAFHFIEINARYWTGLHTELYAGIDIPRLQMDAFFGQPAQPCPPGKPVWCRYTVPGELGYVISVVKDKNLPLRRKAWAIGEFFLLTLHPGVRSDLNFPGDRKLYYLAWYRFVRRALSRKAPTISKDDATPTTELPHPAPGHRDLGGARSPHSVS
jgi:hypothetical protein